MSDRRDAPRIGPASREELGPVNALLVRIAGRVAKTTAPPNLFTTMGRNRRMFRLWLLFAGTLMPRGGLPRATPSWSSSASRTGPGPSTRRSTTGRWAAPPGSAPSRSTRSPATTRPPGRSRPARPLLLRAVDELHDGDAIGEETFAALSERALRPRPRRALHARRPLRDARGPDQLAADRVGHPPVSGPVAGKAVFVTGAAGGIGRATRARGGAARRAPSSSPTSRPSRWPRPPPRSAAGAGGSSTPSRSTSPTTTASSASRRTVHADHGSLDVVMNVAGTRPGGPSTSSATSTGGRWSRST